MRRIPLAIWLFVLATNGSLAGLRQRIRDRTSRVQHADKTEGED